MNSSLIFGFCLLFSCIYIVSCNNSSPPELLNECSFQLQQQAPNPFPNIVIMYYLDMDEGQRRIEVNNGTVNQINLEYIDATSNTVDVFTMYGSESGHCFHSSFPNTAPPPNPNCTNNYQGKTSCSQSTNGYCDSWINKCKVRFGFTYTTDVWGYNATGRDSQPVSSTTVNQYGTFASTVYNYVVGSPDPSLFVLPSICMQLKLENEHLIKIGKEPLISRYPSRKHCHDDLGIVDEILPQKTHKSHKKAF